MILDEIVLHNFGLYKGRHSVPLAPPSSQKPIVLFGGLNGGGKTTFVDALQLALYGRSARLSNRGPLAYDDYLRRSINRAVPPREGAALEIQFRQTSEGREHTYRVHRSWSAGDALVREHVEVLRDGHLDRVLTEQWGEHVEEFLPVRLSHLFFFDGEKIEALADLESSAELLGTAIYSLLGLDLVERLSSDLVVFERRKRTAAKSEADRRRIEELKGAVTVVKERRATLVQERGRLWNELERSESRLADLEETFRTEGGELVAERPAIDAEKRSAEARLKTREGELREVAAGVAPLLLVRDLLGTVVEQVRREDLADQAVRLGRLLAERDADVLVELAGSGAPKKAVTTLTRFLDEDRTRREAAAGAEVYLRLGADARDDLKALVSTALPEAERQIAKLVEAVRAERAAIDAADRRLAAVPDEGSLREVAGRIRDARRELDVLRAKYETAGVQLDALAAEIAQREAELASEIEKALDAEFEQDDANRMVRHTRRVRETLERFRTALVMRRVEQIERLVFDSFRQLLRKQSLVTGISIDPERFTVELHGPDGRTISPERLSAGERQLLAVAMLWGLGRASGRPLPTVIDTPLGRLDATHRLHLVERYFPQASHQVLLLSTDKEIDSDYFDKLKPFVGRAYRLDYDEGSHTTSVEEGYFW